MMNAAYRLLGVVAWINHGLSHQLINGLPLNYALLFGSALGLLISSTRLDNGGETAVWGPIAGISALVFALILQSEFRRNVVFRPAPPDRAAAASVSWESIRLRVSARFTPDETSKSVWARRWESLLYGTRKSRFFLDVPAQLALLETGEVGFVAFLDPSLRLFGLLRLENKAGAWLAAFRRDSFGEPEWGRLYLGRSDRAALRLRCLTTAGRRRKAVLTFENDQERQAFAASWQELLQAGSRSSSVLEPPHASG